MAMLVVPFESSLATFPPPSTNFATFAQPEVVLYWSDGLETLASWKALGYSMLTKYGLERASITARNLEKHVFGQKSDLFPLGDVGGPPV